MRGSVAVQVPKVDPNRCGPDVRQGVNNRIAGSGTALCNTNVLQDRMYFEVKIINPDGASLRTPPAAPELRIRAALSCRFWGCIAADFFAASARFRRPCPHRRVSAGMRRQEQLAEA